LRKHVNWLTLEYTWRAVIGSVRQRFQILSATIPLPSEYTRSKRGGPVLLDSIVRVCCALHNVCDIIVPTV